MDQPWEGTQLLGWLGVGSIHINVAVLVGSTLSLFSYPESCIKCFAAMFAFFGDQFDGFAAESTFFCVHFRFGMRRRVVGLPALHGSFLKSEKKIEEATAVR